MTLLGQNRQDLPFTACSQFQPTVLEGQLCYSLDPKKLAQLETKGGKKAGIVFIVDQGPTDDNTALSLKESLSPLDLEAALEEKAAFRLYIDTLESFTGNGGGSYGLSVLKKITGTQSFLKQTDDIKKCQIGTFESCHVERYMEAVQTKCGCVPWAFSDAVDQQVCRKPNIFAALHSPEPDVLPAYKL